MRFHDSFSRCTCTLLLFLLHSSLPSWGQNEANNWPLGQAAGVTFQSGSPEKATLQGFSATRVGAVISDGNGNLVFYTDGEHVWDKTNSTMPNGHSLRGEAFCSRVQICPKPGDPSRYFIFTTSSTFNWGVPDDVARFSEVDLCQNNGLGDIVAATKNTALTTAIMTRGAVVKHANGIDYWVAFHRWQSDQFYCFRVTENGVDPTPVISSVGSYLGLSSNATGDGGDMKFSADGTRLGIVVLQYATAEVVDFDAQTGIFSNGLTIPAIYRQGYLTPDYTWGIEFSPDSRKLYVTRTNACLLTQYDLDAGNQEAIVKSRVILAGDTLIHNNYDFYTVFGLQLGPDGKIYAAWNDASSSGISVISSPNEAGLGSNYQHNILSWSNEAITPHYFYSFPNFEASLFKGQSTIQNDFSCMSASINFWIKSYYSDALKEIDHVVWDFDDPLSGALNSSQEIYPTHTFTSSGQHRITCVITWKDNTVSTLQQILKIPDELMHGDLDILPSNAILCKGNSLSLDAGKLGSVRWQDGSVGPQFVVTTAGEFWFTICLSGCILSDSVTVEIEELVDPLGSDTTLCDLHTTLELTSSPYRLLQWQDNTSGPSYLVTKPGIYWAILQSQHCTFRDSVVVDYCEDAIFIPNVITPNGDDANDSFILTGIDAEQCIVRIYGRDGLLRYESSSYKNDWNGNGLAAGVYYYHISNSTTQQSFKGWVHLFR